MDDPLSVFFPYSYYMDGRVNRVEDFLKTRLLDTLTEQIGKVIKVRVMSKYLNPIQLSCTVCQLAQNRPMQA